jgi:hypothetical protein
MTLPTRLRWAWLCLRGWTPKRYVTPDEALALLNPAQLKTYLRGVQAIQQDRERDEWLASLPESQRVRLTDRTSADGK